jgi:DNA-binding NtrC family response regulator
MHDRRRNRYDAEDTERLLAGARVVIRRLSDTSILDKNFSLYGAVHEFEAKLIGQALDESGGSVTKAARILGLSHQTLIAILDSRHKALAAKRTPVQKRLKSIIKIPKE